MHCVYVIFCITENLPSTGGSSISEGGGAMAAPIPPKVKIFLNNYGNYSLQTSCINIITKIHA
jgi:hypothetical protein